MKNITSAILGFTLLAGSAFAAQTPQTKPATSEKAPVAESKMDNKAVKTDVKTDAKATSHKSHKKQSKTNAPAATTAQVAPAAKSATPAAK